MRTIGSRSAGRKCRDLKQCKQTESETRDAIPTSLGGCTDREPFRHCKFTRAEHRRLCVCEMKHFVLRFRVRHALEWMNKTRCKSVSTSPKIACTVHTHNSNALDIRHECPIQSVHHRAPQTTTTNRRTNGKKCSPKNLFEINPN